MLSPLKDPALYPPVNRIQERRCCPRLQPRVIAGGGREPAWGDLPYGEVPLPDLIDRLAASVRPAKLLAAAPSRERTRTGKTAAHLRESPWQHRRARASPRAAAAGGHHRRAAAGGPDGAHRPSARPGQVQGRRLRRPHRNVADPGRGAQLAPGVLLPGARRRHLQRRPVSAGAGPDRTHRVGMPQATKARVTLRLAGDHRRGRGRLSEAQAVHDGGQAARPDARPSDLAERGEGAVKPKELKALLSHLR